jgi:hypothetical protein
MTRLIDRWLLFKNIICSQKPCARKFTYARISDPAFLAHLREPVTFIRWLLFKYYLFSETMCQKIYERSDFRSGFSDSLR